jgi:hypothetical protein
MKLIMSGVKIDSDANRKFRGKTDGYSKRLPPQDPAMFSTPPKSWISDQTAV